MIVLGRKALEDILTDNDFWAEQKTKMLARVERRFRHIFDEGVAFARTIDVPGYSAAAKDFLDPPLEAVDDIADRLFRNYLDDWWAQLEHTTRERLREAIIRAAREGTGTPGVIDDIRGLFGETRARWIGVTETTRLFGRGAVATYMASGMQGWEWRTASDARVCPICEGLNGEQFPIETPFDPAHVSCRCFASPVLVLARNG